MGRIGYGGEGPALERDRAYCKRRMLFRGRSRKLVRLGRALRLDASLVDGGDSAG